MLPTQVFLKIPTWTVNHGVRSTCAFYVELEKLLIDLMRLRSLIGATIDFTDCFSWRRGVNGASQGHLC
jgi:hypothetical protein